MLWRWLSFPLFTVVPWAAGAVLLYVLFWVILAAVGGRSKRRKQWAPVLDSEVKRWSAKTCAQLLSELADQQAYQVEFESRQYQVEVELLENTATYLHVLVAVDDGSLPASASPLSTSFLRYKNGSDPEPRQ
jgi:hypothetical protein